MVSGKKISSREKLSWDTIKYVENAPECFLIPEHHWPNFQKTSLSVKEKIRLNHFACFFMCEMFVHFERLIIEYIKIHENIISKYLNERQIRKFVDEELDHINAFQTLAKIIRPDLYSPDQRFLLPTAGDRFVIRHSPPGVFFIMAALFEEMTVFVYEVMKEKLDESWKPVMDVMHLHALEERGHISMDRKIADGIREEKGIVRAQMEMTMLLPLVAYSDRRVAGSWKKAAEFFADSEGFSLRKKKEILNKGLSRSDLLGMKSFADKISERPIAGTGTLRFVLNRMAG